MNLVRYRVYPPSDVEPSVSNINLEHDFVPNRQQSPSQTKLPALDLKEDSHSYYVMLEVPGVTRAKLDISLQEKTLLIRGHKERRQQEKDVTLHRTERGCGSFSRGIVLPSPVKSDHTKARLDNGVLLVTLPKQEETKTRQIPIGSR